MESGSSCLRSGSLILEAGETYAIPDGVCPLKDNPNGRP